MSAEHNKVANATKRVAESKAREEHIHNAAKNAVDSGNIDVKREATASSANSAANRAQADKHFIANQANGGGKPMTLHQELNQYRADLKGLEAEAKDVAGGEESDEYKKQHGEHVKSERQRIQNKINELESKGAKSESGANPFVFDPSKEPKVEPGMLSGIGDWISQKTNGTTPKPVAPPAPKPLPGFTITKNK